MSEINESTFQSLPPLERAYYFQKLVTEGTSASKIAKKIGKSLAYVSNTLRLLKLPLMVQDGLASGIITEGHARALLGVKKMEDTIVIYREIIVTNATVRTVELLVRKKTKFDTGVSGLPQTGEQANT
jgi:ParB family transcriptional regulator, chromosome partitioning protein